MSEKIDNPPDHKHSDYGMGGWAIAFSVGTFLVVFALIGGLQCQSSQLKDRLDRMEIEAECRLADDESECLRGYLP